MFVGAIGKVDFGASCKKRLDYKRMRAFGIIVSETVIFNFVSSIQSS